MHKSFLAVIASAMMLSGCHVGNLSVYKIDIQQGNVLTRDQVDQLKVGMTPLQVRFLLGSPLIVDPFHPERWDYAYSYRPGTYARLLKIPGVAHRDLSLWFAQGKLAKIEGQDQVPVKAIVTPLVTPEKGAAVSEHEQGHADADGS